MKQTTKNNKRPGAAMTGTEAPTSPSDASVVEKMNGKPVLFRDAQTILTDPSHEFHEKLLCDGLIFNAGDACAFGCAYCYVESSMRKLVKGLIDEHNTETGQDLGFHDVVIRRRDAIEVIKSQLVKPDGTPIYDDPDDRRVIYSSTLVDVAANKKLFLETVKVVHLILEHTNWQVRLLSKSALLAKIVDEVPEEYHPRLILGFSIGTLDDKLAAAIERGTSSPSRRIKALHELQDRGIRTFGMICPSLPQDDYDAFSRQVCDAIRVDRCEHVWAEVINVRGKSMTRTVEALADGGFDDEVRRLESVCGPDTKQAWEAYARATFQAHTRNIPPEKLRFLQYVAEGSAKWWKQQRDKGAILIGEAAKRLQLTTGGESAPAMPLPNLTKTDIKFRNEREEIVTLGVKASISAAKALFEIRSYKGGLLWKTDFLSFERYCLAKWGYAKSHAYRLVESGEFLAQLVDADSPNGENLPRNEGHVRSLFAAVPKEDRVECWKEIVAERSADQLTGPIVEREAKKFVRRKGPSPEKPAKPNAALRLRTQAKGALEKLRIAVEKLPAPQRFGPLLGGLEQLINQDPDGEPEEKGAKPADIAA